jgi:hypothetical protein
MDNINNTILKLKNEFFQNTPEVWESIQKKIAEEMAADLLQQLDGLPSPKGKLLIEKRDELMERLLENKICRLGA